MRPRDRNGGGTPRRARDRFLAWPNQSCDPPSRASPITARASSDQTGRRPGAGLSEAGQGRAVVFRPDRPTAAEMDIRRLRLADRLGPPLREPSLDFTWIS